MFKLKDDVDLPELLNGFKNNLDSYDLDSLFDEFISINKHTRVIHQHGYNGLLTHWASKGLLENC